MTELAFAQGKASPGIPAKDLDLLHATPMHELTALGCAEYIQLLSAPKDPAASHAYALEVLTNSSNTKLNQMDAVLFQNCELEMLTPIP